MKILFVNNFFSEYGGTEKLFLNQAELLEENNLQVFFFASSKEPLFIKDYKYKKYFPEFQDYRNAGIFKSIKNISGIFYNKQAKINLKEYLKEIKPDVVHIHNIYYNLTSSVIDACKEMNIPVVMSVNDPRIVCPGGTFMYKGKSYCKKEKCIKSHPLHCVFNKCKDKNLKSSIIATAENIFNKLTGKLDYVSYFICPSMALGNLLLRAGFESSKLKFIPNFLDDKFLDIRPEYNRGGYFLYVGRLSEEKGVNYLLKAMSLLPEEIKVHIVGDGQQRQELEDYANHLNLDNVIFKGFLEGKELEEEYKNCIATVLPCNWFEAFGLTIIESFACAKPVIASRIGAIPELVTDFETGFTFEPGNIKELADAVYKLYSDKELTAKMSVKARKTAEQLFNSKLHYESLKKVYDSVVNKEKTSTESVAYTKSSF